MEFHRNEEKDIWLLAHRWISFEDVVHAIAQWWLLAEELHDNQEKYTGQYIYFVRIEKYVYRVPFIRQKNGNVFLKTVIPSRLAIKRFIW